MADIVDRATRSRMMSGIRGKDTRPEIAIRSALFRLGFRYRLHDRRLPGRPDLVFAKYRAVIFVHGCFWHLHGCTLTKLPGTNRDFWQGKLETNVQRDGRNVGLLRDAGWRVLEVWECAIRSKPPKAIARTADRIAAWLIGKRRFASIGGPVRNLSSAGRRRGAADN